MYDDLWDMWLSLLATFPLDSDTSPPFFFSTSSFSIDLPSIDNNNIYISLHIARST
ncbi:hypothetical protein HanXRQr2_Chr01g0031061 [Helianthus annuus]|uniref:Uncharacterized protein n=1 Tax=Helianthus annuus TaxID=4232 RepID=A0A9K3JY80_HELAN|nr:hypothetical protein HanXRQr2_Chr01g0031061 [Helianthus annuus]KAJ0957668.1 hypothetical protein HanPSC8_Chr01g0030351 [Helianthus annuus]